MDIDDLKTQILALIFEADLNQVHVAQMLEDLAEEQRREVSGGETA